MSSGSCTPFTQVTVQWKGQDVLVKLELDPVAKRFKMRMPDISSDRWCWAGEIDEKAEIHVKLRTPVLIHPAKHGLGGMHLQILHSFLLKAVWYAPPNQCRPRPCCPPMWEVAPKANVDLKKPQATFPNTSVHSILNGMTVDEMRAMCMEVLLAKHKHNILQDSLSKLPKFNLEDACPLCPEEDHAEHDDNDDDFPCKLCTLDADEIDDTLETDLLPALPPEYDNSVQPKRQRELTQDQLDRISERREEAMRRKRQRDITNGTLGNPGNITPQRREALQDGTHLDDTQDMPIQEGPAPVELGPSSENHEAGQH